MPFSQGAFSTLDLVSNNKVEFLLIIAPIEDSYQLARTAFKVAEEFNVTLKVCVMWQENTTNGTRKSEMELSPWKNYIDVIKPRNCPTTSPPWWDLCQMTDRGAILVRPDEHIAWRSKVKIEKDSLLVLREVFGTVLGLYSSST